MPAGHTNLEVVPAIASPQSHLFSIDSLDDFLYRVRVIDLSLYHSVEVVIFLLNELNFTLETLLEHIVKAESCWW